MSGPMDVHVVRASALVDLLVDEVLDRRSVALAAPRDGIDEPHALRPTSGLSVYTAAGAALYIPRGGSLMPRPASSPRPDSAAATVDPTTVDLAMLEVAANGTALDAGQAALVRQLTGARLQLAIAPAGAGKTTAMRTLVLAWTADSGRSGINAVYEVTCTAWEAPNMKLDMNLDP
jgi:AAA domain